MNKNKQLRIDVLGNKNVINIYTDETKRCTKCNKIFPLSKEYWYVNSINKTGFQTHCKLCKKEYEKSDKRKEIYKKYNKSEKAKKSHKKSQKKYNNSEKGLYFRQKTNLKKFNMTPEDRNNMVIEQKNRCKICGCLLDQRKIRSPIDHNHKTKIVRGILCNHCNTLIGLSKDNPYILINAIRYLENKDLNENFYYTL